MARILLDTHAFLWFILGNPRFSPLARSMIE
jgi:PIN domain nuclease of toxin-antitoxin system